MQLFFKIIKIFGVDAEIRASDIELQLQEKHKKELKGPYLNEKIVQNPKLTQELSLYSSTSKRADSENRLSFLEKS